MRERWRRNGTALVTATSLGLVLGSGLGGCGVDEGLASMREQALHAQDAIRADRAELVGLVESLPQRDPARERAEMMIRARDDQADVFGRAAERLGALIESAESGEVGRTIETGTGMVLPFLPAGAQVPALLAAGLAASLWRAVRLKKSAVSIAQGLEKAMQDDEQLREGVRRHAETFRTAQTPTARRIVDEVTKTGKVRLPV